MALTYQAISAIATAAAGTTSITLTEPAGTQMGDMLVAVISYRSNVAWTVPTGWTKREEQNTGDTQTTSAAIASIVVADIVRGASAPSLVFTRAAGELARGYIVALRPTAGNYAVYEGSASTTLAAAAVTLTVPGVTTGGTGRVLVAGMAGVRGNGSANWSAQACTDPATMTERADVSVSTSPTLSISVSAASQAGSGATGNFNATCVFSGRHAGALLSYYETPYTGATVLLTDSDVSGGVGTPYTATGKSFGGATTSDYTIVCLGYRATSAITVTSVVIDGVTATKLAEQWGDNGGGQWTESSLWIIPATGNATGNIVTTYSAAARGAISVYRLRGASPTPVETAITATAPQSVSLLVPANGCAVATGMMSQTTGITATWTGLLEDVDVAFASAHCFTSASAQFLTLQNKASITCTYNVSDARNAFASASFGPPAVTITGTVDQTITRTTQDASGTVTAAPAVTGTIAQTITAATQAASGTVTAAPAITGTAAQTLSPAQQSASGTVTAAPAVSGTIAQTITHAAQAASGSVATAGAIVGQIDQTITRTGQALAGTVTAAPAVTGTIVQALQPAQQAATGTVAAVGAIVGTIAQTAPSASQAASGTVSGGIQPPEGRPIGGFAGWSDEQEKAQRKYRRLKRKAEIELREMLEAQMRGEEYPPAPVEQVLEALAEVAAAPDLPFMPDLGDLRSQLRLLEEALRQGLAEHELRQRIAVQRLIEEVAIVSLLA